jgi:hypothetical protein
MNAAARQEIAAHVRVPAYVNIEAICAEYVPYTEIKEFNTGFADYLDGQLCNTAHRGGVEQQAYERGYEAGMRVMKFARWVDENVGAN